MQTNIVRKITEQGERQSVLCTTYQMRNCFRQFADGVASELDVHCYSQHAFAADLCPNGGRVLDVCCGRGLLIPFLRYRAKPKLYVGVDIEPNNAKWRTGVDPRRESETKTDWGFERLFVQSNVADMDKALTAAGHTGFNLIVYTSSIEHMQPEAQQHSLWAARRVATKGARLVLTCPVTQEGANGYEAQYAAHVYEPKESELFEWLKASGWLVLAVRGVCTKATVFKAVLGGSQRHQALSLYDAMPREFALPAIAALFPSCATERLYVCTAQ